MKNRSGLEIQPWKSLQPQTELNIYDISINEQQTHQNLHNKIIIPKRLKKNSRRLQQTHPSRTTSFQQPIHNINAPNQKSLDIKSFNDASLKDKKKTKSLRLLSTSYTHYERSKLSNENHQAARQNSDQIRFTKYKGFERNKPLKKIVRECKRNQQGKSVPEKKRMKSAIQMKRSPAFHTYNINDEFEKKNIVINPIKVEKQRDKRKQKEKERKNTEGEVFQDINIFTQGKDNVIEGLISSLRKRDQNFERKSHETKRKNFIIFQQKMSMMKKHLPLRKCDWLC